AAVAAGGIRAVDDPVARGRPVGLGAIADAYVVRAVCLGDVQRGVLGVAVVVVLHAGERELRGVRRPRRVDGTYLDRDEVLAAAVGVRNRQPRAAHVVRHETAVA